MKRYWKKNISAMLAAVLSLSLCACGTAPAAKPDDGRLQVVATNFPAYDFARAVCGDAAEVQMLLPPGAESHSYEPTPQDMIDVENCDLFIYTGGESDTWVDTILNAVDGEREVLRMIDCVPTLEEETVEGMTTQGHDHEEDHEEGGVVDVDEHVWTSPVNAVQIVEHIGERVVALDESHAETYVKNENAYLQELLALDGDFREFFDSISNPVMVFGDRFPLRYFASEYNLKYYAAFPGCSTQTEPSAATIAFLTEKIRQEQLSTVYYIEFSNHLVADSIAEATGAQTALFHSCHNVSRQEMEAGATYVSLMRGNLETLRQTMR